MKMESEHVIPASQDHVWEALNDIEVLRLAIPGCEEVERLEDGALKARVRIKVGPVSATFAGRLSFEDVDAPHGYTLHFEGQGGMAGHARGQATVRLHATGPQVTTLAYVAHAQIGGRLAQVGARLIEGVAAKTSGLFFDAFVGIVSAKQPQTTT